MTNCIKVLVHSDAPALTGGIAGDVASVPASLSCYPAVYAAVGHAVAGSGTNGGAGLID